MALNKVTPVTPTAEFGTVTEIISSQPSFAEHFILNKTAFQIHQHL